MTRATAVHEVLDQRMGNAAGRGRGWQCIKAEKAGFGNFLLLKAQFATRVLGMEAQHQVIGKWPGLAAEITEIGHVDADLVGDPVEW